MSVVLIDATSSSLTVSWPPTEGATRYILEYKTAQQDEFQVLSDKLTQPQARKRNLDDHAGGYLFRAGAIVGDITEVTSWAIHDEAFQLLTADQESQCMAAAPTAKNAGSNQTLIISWQAVDLDGAAGYELQMRENQGGAEWITIAPSLASTQVRKKNLTSKLGYQFRVRPATVDRPFSPASEAVVAKGLSEGIQRFFNSLEEGTLLRSGVKEPVPLADALGGKEFVLLYVSAHWCPPCRKFTPMLANWYQTVKSQVEVVFLSCDHDDKGFQSYFASHPWMAVDYDDDAREALQAAIRVQGIPRLVVLSGATGKVIVDNAVGQPLDINRWRTMAAGK
jgi:thiol-disulfide isomerase/thioredoxin